MSLTVEVVCGAILGVAAGVVSGAICGGIAAYIEGYFSSFARMFDCHGRNLVAKASICNGRGLGALAGFIVGGVSGGIGNLHGGLVAWFWISAILVAWLRRDLEDHIIGLVSGIFAGGFAAAIAGYGSRLMVNAF